MGMSTMIEVSQDKEKLFPGEYIDDVPNSGATTTVLSESDINTKYVKGEVRIVTEQARYPIHSFF